jgi:hypothetical protein
MSAHTHGVASAAAAVDNYSVETEDVVFGNKLEKKTKDGKEIVEKTPVVLPSTDASALAKEGKFDEENAGIVTTKVTYPKTWAGLLEFVGADSQKQDEAVKNFVRGATQKVINRRNAALLAQDDDGNFTFTLKPEENGVLDLTEHILSESKRKVLSAEEKFDRNMEAMGIAKGSKKYETMKQIWLSAN